jgi:hypothetical protein
MESQRMSEWLGSLSNSEMLRALALFYSELTVGTRQLFQLGATNGAERGIIDVLHGINELHHTVANQLAAYSFKEGGYPHHLFVQQLLDIANQYGIRDLLAQSVDFVESQNLSIKE